MEVVVLAKAVCDDEGRVLAEIRQGVAQGRDVGGGDVEELL